MKIASQSLFIKFLHAKKWSIQWFESLFSIEWNCPSRNGLWRLGNGRFWQSKFTIAVWGYSESCKRTHIVAWNYDTDNSRTLPPSILRITVLMVVANWKTVRTYNRRESVEFWSSRIRRVGMKESKVNVYNGGRMYPTEIRPYSFLLPLPSYYHDDCVSSSIALHYRIHRTEEKGELITPYKWVQKIKILFKAISITCSKRVFEFAMELNRRTKVINFITSFPRIKHWQHKITGTNSRRWFRGLPGWTKGVERSDRGVIHRFALVCFFGGGF